MPEDIEDNHLEPEHPPLGRQFASERLLSRMKRMIDTKQFSSAEELNQELERLRESGALDLNAEKPWDMGDRERAQEYAYRAMESPDADEAARWSRRALDYDPANLDARRTLITIEERNVAATIEKLKPAIESEERRLGPEVFENTMGHFYGAIETRPYMRALQDLAYLCEKDGRHDEAMAVKERMLDLNNRDNLGVRYGLLGDYLLEKSLEKAKGLIGRYQEDVGAGMLWGKVLERWLAEDFAGAKAALAAARKWNRHAEKYMNGTKPMPAHEPAAYQLGEESEAKMCAHEVGRAWAKYPAAREWLKQAK
jgi:tetratricopeptide (TPR) repeat protein